MVFQVQTKVSWTSGLQFAGMDTKHITLHSQFISDMYHIKQFKLCHVVSSMNITKMHHVGLSLV